MFSAGEFFIFFWGFIKRMKGVVVVVVGVGGVGVVGVVGVGSPLPTSRALSHVKPQNRLVEFAMMTLLFRRHLEQYLQKSRFARYLQYFRDVAPFYIVT